MLLSNNELNSQNLEEFTALLEEYKTLNVNCFMEIGSMYGWSLQHFIHYSNKESTAVVIDLPVRNFIGPGDWRVATQESNYKNVWPEWAKAKKCKLFLIPDSSIKESTFNKAKDILNGKQLDFLFIDGDHRYEAIKSDYEMYSPLVRLGGVIGFHDIGEREEGGGRQFWNEIKNKFKYREILLDLKQEKGIGLLYV